MFMYLVYNNLDCDPIAGFNSLCKAIGFIEDYYFNRPVPLTLVDSETGEVIDTWVNGTWESGKEW